jgi:hypothetical protein
MFTHLTIGTNNLERDAMAFYDAVLAPLGIERVPSKYDKWARLAASWRSAETTGRLSLQSTAGKLGQWLDGDLYGAKPGRRRCGVCCSNGEWWI